MVAPVSFHQTLTLWNIVVLTVVAMTLTVLADECGTKFTDLASSSVLAHAIVKGSIRAFNPMSRATRTHTANITVTKVYKGERLVAGASRDDVIMVQRFGEEDREACVASAAVVPPNVEHMFFLRPTSNRMELQMSAFPVQNDVTVVRRVRRSLCPTCVRPPTIRKLTCKNCAKAPVIKAMKSKKVKMGQRARLRCTARGKPRPKFSWTKDGVPVVSGSGGITVRDTATTSALLFRRTMDAHAGQYMCKAENEMGEMEKGVTLELTLATTPRRRPPRPDPVANASASLSRFYEQMRKSPENDVNLSIGRVASSRNSPHRRPPVASRSENPGLAEQDPEESQPGTMGADGGVAVEPAMAKHPLMNSPVTKSSESATTPTTQSTSTTNIASTAATRLRKKSKKKSYSKSKYQRKDKLKSRLQNRFLKTVTCKDKTYCKNGGRCTYVVKLDVRFCKCRPGFVGRQCELSA